MPSMPSASPRGSALTLLADLPNRAGTLLAFAPQGSRWALADGRSVRVGDDGPEDLQLTAPEPAVNLAWSPDGQRVLAFPHTYDLASQSWLPRPNLGPAMISGLDASATAEQFGVVAGAFSPKGRELVVAARFSPSRDLGAEDEYRGPSERLLLLGEDHAVRGVLHAGAQELRAVAMSERYVAAAVGTKIFLWDRQTLRKLGELAHHRATPRALAFDAKSELLGALAADGEVSLWDTATGALVTSFAAHQGDGYCLTFHPTRDLLATGGQDGKLRLWSRTGRLQHEAAHDGWIRAVAFDASGARLGAAVHARPPRLVIYGVPPAADSP